MNNSLIALFDDNILSLPADYEPVRPAYMEVPRIYLAKGSVCTPERRQL